MEQLTKREEYIKTMFVPPQKNKHKQYISEDEAIKIVKKISSLGENIGFVGDNANKNKDKDAQRSHKFDVWIAKEVKKNADILKKEKEIRFIIDWASETKCDLFKYDFDLATSEQKAWHEKLMNDLEIKNIDVPNLDNNRIVFRCSDKKHFIYVLTEKDLKYEGKKMKNCVWGSSYIKKVKAKKSMIISLRDEKNEPHITAEIDIARNKVLQLLGKTNSTPKDECLNKFLEFVLFYTNYDKIENKQALKYLNINNLI